MAPSNLQGLNLIHPESPPSNLTDAQDLLSTPIFPDFAPNDLDLWSSINFASDEPFVSAKDRQLKTGQTETGSTDHKEANLPATAPAGQDPQFDFVQFLSNFGLHPNGNPGVVLPDGSVPTFPQGFGAPLAVPPAPPVPTPVPSAAQSTASTPAPEAAPSAPKRARTTKTPAPATASASTSSDASSNLEPDITTPISASEDKRRRNTAASARFRLKKKEREAALDARAHALEDRVNELERECESLRRENGWLRGLVVGVTGGVVPTMSDAPILPPGSAPPSTSGPTPAQTGTAEKRKRDEAT